MRRIHRIYHTIKVKKNAYPPFSITNNQSFVKHHQASPVEPVKRMTSQLAVKTSKPASCDGCTKAANSRPLQENWLGVGDKNIVIQVFETKDQNTKKNRVCAHNLLAGFVQDLQFSNCVLFWIGCQHRDFQFPSASSGPGEAPPWKSRPRKDG